MGGLKSNLLVEALLPSSSDACIAPRILDLQKKEFGLFWRKVSYVFPPLHKESLVFHRSFRLLMQIFLCLHQKSLGFSQDFPSSHAALSIFFHKFPHFSAFWPHCTKHFWGFTGFPSSDATCPMFFHFFGTTAPRILGFFTGFLNMLGPTVLHPKSGFSQNFPFLMLSHDFASSDAKFPTCAYKQTYHHGASRICKNLQVFWPKAISVCKAIFYIFKI